MNIKNMETGALSSLSFSYIARSWKKGFRNGNWSKLKHIEKALYMASLSLAKMRGRIVNSKLILELRAIICKLRETVGIRLMQTGYQRTIKLYERFMAVGLFEWAPQAKLWFDDPAYIMWLGISS